MKGSLKNIGLRLENRQVELKDYIFLAILFKKIQTPYIWQISTIIEIITEGKSLLVKKLGKTEEVEEREEEIDQVVL